MNEPHSLLDLLVANTAVVVLAGILTLVIVPLLAAIYGAKYGAHTAHEIATNAKAEDERAKRSAIATALNFEVTSNRRNVVDAQEDLVEPFSLSEHTLAVYDQNLQLFSTDVVYTISRYREKFDRLARLESDIFRLSNLQSIAQQITHKMMYADALETAMSEFLVEADEANKALLASKDVTIQIERLPKNFPRTLGTPDDSKA